MFSAGSISAKLSEGLIFELEAAAGEDGLFVSNCSAHGPVMFLIDQVVFWESGVADLPHFHGEAC